MNDVMTGSAVLVRFEHQLRTAKVVRVCCLKVIVEQSVLAFINAARTQ